MGSVQCKSKTIGDMGKGRRKAVKSRLCFSGMLLDPLLSGRVTRLINVCEVAAGE